MMMSQQSYLKPTICTPEHAIHLNNEGVRHSLEGRDDQAIVLFSRAIKIFKEIIARCGTTQRSSDIFSLSQCEQLHDRRLQLPHFSSSRQVYLFNKAITLKFLVGGYPTLTSQVYCSVIILNIALIHHRQGLLRNRDDLLVKATRFYEMLPGIIPPNDQKTGLMVRIAAMNNLSQLQVQRAEEYGNNEQEQHASLNGFKQLLAFVSYLEFNKVDLFTKQEMKGILLNALMGSIPRAPAASAA